MRFDHLQYHLNRRQMLAGMAKAGAAGAALTAGGLQLTGTAGGATAGSTGSTGTSQTGPWDDSLSIEGAANGEWAAETAARYGADDERGAVNEITPAKSAAALAMLAGASEVNAYNLGHLLVNGIPAFRTFPPRLYSQRLISSGYVHADPQNWFSTTTTGNAGVDEWRAADRARGPLGYVQGTEPAAANQISGHEERFLEGGTYQCATQLDGLTHIGVGRYFYNGNDPDDFATPLAATKLGSHLVGPLVTRGLLVDILGWKQSQGGSDVQTINGRQMLTDTYRITVDDIQATMAWEGLGGIEPGDVVLLRTGWWWLADDPDTYDHYLDTEPGINIAEAKFFADHRPAIVGADTWALEVVGNTTDVDPAWAFPAHTILIPKNGIRIGEGIITDSLAELGQHEFVYTYMGQYAYGCTAGNTSPVALVGG